MEITYNNEATSIPDTDNPAVPRPYTNKLEHLFEELERIDIYIQSELKRIQHIYTSDNLYRGLYISDADVERYIDKPIGQPWWSVIHNIQDGDEQRAVADRNLVNISNRIAASSKSGTLLQFDRLSKIFNLSRMEQDVLLLCLAPEIDTKYDLIYAYLQDDITKKYMTIDLALNILCATSHDKIMRRDLFCSQSSLIRHHILETSETPLNQQAGSFLNKAITIQPRIVSFLLSEHSEDPGLILFIETIPPANTVAALPTHGLAKQIIQSTLDRLGDSNHNHIIYLSGKTGSGRIDIARLISSYCNKTILKLDIDILQSEQNERFADVIDKFIREAYLHSADIYLAETDRLANDKTCHLHKKLLNAIQEYTGLVYLAGRSSWPHELNSITKPFTTLELPHFNESDRLHLWKEVFTLYSLKPANKDLKIVASRFRFTPQQIRDAAKTAVTLTENSPHSGKKLNCATLFRACRINSNRKLAVLAQKIKPKYDWDDITLGSDKREQLRGLCDAIKHHHIVFNDWGFSKKLSIGKGTSVLFSGPPGTGKTMAAEIIANNLGLDLYKIDLSLIVSKYIGETEKNLSRIFDEAETSNAVLFFDEADALFGKRTEIKDSHDRYANIEVSYLLQRIEAYEGVTILATNLRKNLDDAFLRRLSDIVEFPVPKVSERKQIWTQIWPRQAPLSDEIDFDFLASRFKLSGGYIKNIVLTASFMAASLGNKIEMRHLLLATRRELEKQGRTCVKQDFGEYADFFDYQPLEQNYL